MLLFMDKLYFIFKKIFEKLGQLNDRRVFLISVAISSLLGVLIFYIRFSFDTNELFVFDYHDSLPYGSNLTEKFNLFIRKEKLKELHLCSLK